MHKLKCSMSHKKVEGTVGGKGSSLEDFSLLTSHPLLAQEFSVTSPQDGTTKLCPALVSSHPTKKHKLKIPHSEPKQQQPAQSKVTNHHQHRRAPISSPPENESDMYYSSWVLAHQEEDDEEMLEEVCYTACGQPWGTCVHTAGGILALKDEDEDDDDDNMEEPCLRCEFDALKQLVESFQAKMEGHVCGNRHKKQQQLSDHHCEDGSSLYSTKIGPAEKESKKSKNEAEERIGQQQPHWQKGDLSQSLPTSVSPSSLPICHNDARKATAPVKVEQVVPSTNSSSSSCTSLHPTNYHQRPSTVSTTASKDCPSSTSSNMTTNFKIQNTPSTTNLPPSSNRSKRSSSRDSEGMKHNTLRPPPPANMNSTSSINKAINHDEQKDDGTSTAPSFTTGHVPSPMLFDQKEKEDATDGAQSRVVKTNPLLPTNAASMLSHQQQQTSFPPRGNTAKLVETTSSARHPPVMVHRGPNGKIQAAATTTQAASPGNGDKQNNSAIMMSLTNVKNAVTTEQNTNHVEEKNSTVKEGVEGQQVENMNLEGGKTKLTAGNSASNRGASVKSTAAGSYNFSRVSPTAPLLSTDPQFEIALDAATAAELYQKPTAEALMDPLKMIHATFIIYIGTRGVAINGFRHWLCSGWNFLFPNTTLQCEIGYSADRKVCVMLLPTGRLRDDLGSGYFFIEASTVKGSNTGAEVRLDPSDQETVMASDQRTKNAFTALVRYILVQNGVIPAASRSRTPVGRTAKIFG